MTGQEDVASFNAALALCQRDDQTTLHVYRPKNPIQHF